MNELNLDPFVYCQYKKLSNSEKKLLKENSKLKATLKTIQHFKLIIDYQSQNASSDILSNLISQLLNKYDEIKEEIFKDEISNYILVEKSKSTSG